MARRDAQGFTSREIHVVSRSVLISNSEPVLHGRQAASDLLRLLPSEAVSLVLTELVSVGGFSNFLVQ